MNKIVKFAIVLSLPALAIVGCSRPTSGDYNVVVTHHEYDGRVLTKHDMVLYRKNPKHVFIYDGVKYRVHHRDSRYTYYPVY